ncbi:NnrS family protein (plasmid) [Paracoccus ferrooxidans]|nr:NnrS family protein [Paracoccus ferrooxidans]
MASRSGQGRRGHGSPCPVGILTTAALLALWGIRGSSRKTMLRFLTHGLWLAPHRPLFFLAGLWAILVPSAWLLPLGMGVDALSWHRHELLFGMGGAAVGGYLLTALPAWTGRVRVAPATTGIMVALWLAGRLGFALGLPAPFALPAATAYFLVLGGLLSWQVAGAGAWRKMPLALAPLALGGIEALAIAGPGPAAESLAQDMAPLFFALLISLVGGRALAAFTRHWAAASGQPPPTEPRWLPGAGVLALLLAIAALLLDRSGLAGPLLIVSGILHLARMGLWRSWRAGRYPALLLLHLAWLWLPLALILAGLAQAPWAGLDMATALHAVTMGAMGTMMLAIMGRAAMPRRGGRLAVSRPLALAFCLVSLATLLRLLMGCVSMAGPATLLHLAASGWMAGWALFLWDFRHALQGPVPRPVLSASSRA